MKRKVCGVMMLVVMLFALSGCRMYADYKVNSDGTITHMSKVGYTAEEVEALGVDTSQCTLQTLEDGKKYYVTPAETQTMTSEELFVANEMVLNDNIFYYTFSGNMEEAGVSEDEMYMQLSISLNGDIVDTNADLSKEGNKAMFTTNNTATNWYAYTQTGKEIIAADTTVPKMMGAKNNKYYKSIPMKLYFTDNIAVKEVLWNGKLVTSNKLKDENGKVLQSLWSTSDGRIPATQGKNTIQVTDLNGNVSTFTIYIDSKVPVVKGVKNNKAYNKKAVIYVKDSVKLKSIKINGKAQKMGNKQLVKSGKYKGYYKYTVKKKGTNKIVVTDMAGNKKTMKIRIKK
ncbi:MAG: hypothetical protein IJP29_05665 [Lachnospiraceae bacterium]|nr:hypothetical protein [Lachnospiraceae bacterium]